MCAVSNFVCPVDGQPLVKVNTALRCELGHVYDIAREGYCNLLLVQQKASLDPGDNKDMVAARSRFLDDAYFLPIAERLSQIVIELITKLTSKTAYRIVDAGCGDGYYLDQLRQRAKAIEQSGQLELAGCDISKWAIKKAAKRSSDIVWAVAGNKQLPFAPSSVDIILSMFGFPDWKQFNAIQPDGGHVILVEPGPNHLIELRKLIYPQVNVSAPTAFTHDGYIIEKEESLTFSINLETDSINDLLTMTPHGFRISEQAREKLNGLKDLKITVDVMFRILRKNK